MRLLNTKTFELHLFIPDVVPDYVILSHRWSSEEVLFEDIINIPLSDSNSPARKKEGFAKIKGACHLAQQDGYEWIWIDSCCIDKSSSAILQEAINSMWNYYAGSNICYVYLLDVPDSAAGWDNQKFQASEWFTRGWTLQELIAPITVEFYANDWSPLGMKYERSHEIATATRINLNVLLRPNTVHDACVAEKLSWAAHRQVTREEDEAYSLLGLFYVNLPMLYGEGRRKAFNRLQEAIYNSTKDDSLFLFRYSPHSEDQNLIADSPAQFCQRPACTSCPKSATCCFPTTIPYDTVTASTLWNVQAHQPIFTAVTPQGSEVSTVLRLVEYKELSKSLISLYGDALSDAKSVSHAVSHVAILNRTLKDHPVGALCLLVWRTSVLHTAYAIRLKAYPLLLPNKQKVERKMQLYNMLFSMRPVGLDRKYNITTTFALKDNSFLAQSWETRRAISKVIVALEERVTPEFLAHQPMSGFLIQVSTRISDARNPSTQLLLGFVGDVGAWSIADIFEVKPGDEQGSNHAIFVSSGTHTDRCSVRLSNLTQYSIALRPLAACRRPKEKTREKGLHFRFAIVVKRL